MVVLSLHSRRENSAPRYFPHSGYLGLTPLKVEGFVRTRRDEDPKPLLARSITVSVRCYEARVGRLGSVRTNVLADVTHTVWSKPHGVEWSEVGDLDLPFKITLPADIGGLSTTYFQLYRVYWRVEAVINHIPISGVGSQLYKHFELAFIRYNTPPQPSSSHYPKTSSVPVAPNAPPLRYQLTTPTHAIGPSEPVCIPCKLFALESSVFAQKIAVSIERRIVLHETADTIPTPPPTFSRNSKQDQYGSTARLIDSPYPLDFLSPPPTAKRSPSPTSFSMPRKVIPYTFATVEETGLSRDSAGAYTHTFNLEMPSAKSSAHWAVGETMRTELAEVRFFVSVKVTLSTIWGNVDVLLEERELYVAAVGKAERRRAATKSARRILTHDSGKDAEPVLPSPPPSPTLTSCNLSLSNDVPTLPLNDSYRPIINTHASSHQTSSPHTPSPTDQYKPNSSVHYNTINPSYDLAVPPKSSRQKTPSKASTPRRPHTSSGARDSQPATRSHRSQHSSPRPGTGDQRILNAIVPPPPSPYAQAEPVDPVQEWEMELERIASSSRRRTAALWNPLNNRPRTKQRMSGERTGSDSPLTPVSAAS